MTVCGGWSLAKHEPYGTTVITLWCRSWQCADCAPKRVSMLKRLACDGQPSTFITLTVNPREGQDPQDRARELSDAWKIVVKRARRKFTKAPLEYLAVFEETKRGEPHLHILARAPYIPQRWLSAAMNELISAPIVDIRKVGKISNAARYVAKYITKGPKAFTAMKRYWTSQGYDLTEEVKASFKNEWGVGWSKWEEPVFIIAERLERSGLKGEWVNPHHFFYAHEPGDARGSPW